MTTENILSSETTCFPSTLAQKIAQNYSPSAQSNIDTESSYDSILKYYWNIQ